LDNYYISLLDICPHRSISIKPSYFSIDSTRDHIFSSLSMRLWMLHKHEKRRMRTVLQSGDKSHATWSTKKKSRFYSRKICRVMDSGSFVCRDCACPTHALFFFASNSEVAVERKAEKRETQKFVRVPLHSAIFLPSASSYQRFAVAISVWKKSRSFFRITSIAAILFEAFAAHTRDCTVLIASFFIKNNSYSYSGTAELFHCDRRNKGGKGSFTVPKSRSR